VGRSFEAVILLAHGARDSRWAEPFNRMRAELAEKLRPKKVALAFLDFSPPSFADASAEIYGSGARNIMVAPIFLSGGGHVAKDVPELVDAERRRYPDAAFVIVGAIGEEPEAAAGMVQAVSRLARG
jgi:sirohydrochlorin cobaltochelatase